MVAKQLITSDESVSQVMKLKPRERTGEDREGCERTGEDREHRSACLVAVTLSTLQTAVVFLAPNNKSLSKCLT